MNVGHGELLQVRCSLAQGHRGVHGHGRYSWPRAQRRFVHPGVWVALPLVAIVVLTLIAAHEMHWWSW